MRNACVSSVEPTLFVSATLEIRGYGYGKKVDLRCREEPDRRSNSNIHVVGLSFGLAVYIISTVSASVDVTHVGG
jgi:hypothetical protein